MVLWEYRARLSRVIDGDTVELVIDLGFHAQHEERFRLAGVDCAERFTPAGKLATEFVKGWMTARAGEVADDWPLLVRTTMIHSRHGLRQDETLGRYVAAICSQDEQHYLEAALVYAGHGTWRKETQS